MSVSAFRVVVPGVAPSARVPKRPSGPRQTRSLPVIRPAVPLTVNLERALGAGGHASVVPGKLGDKRVAVKVLPLADPQTAKELATLVVIAPGHANVIRSHAPVASPDGAHTYLPMEMAEEDLLAYTDRAGGLDEAAAASLFRGVMDGVAFLHSRGVCHLDLKPENILMAGGVPKVADFGTAVFRDVATIAGLCGPHRTSADCGTAIYACPEALALHFRPASPQCDAHSNSGASSVSASSFEGEGYDAEKADVWALGVSLFVCVTGVFPWRRAEVTDKWYAAWQDSYATMGLRCAPSLFKHTFGVCASQQGVPLSPAFIHLLRCMLTPSPHKRPTLAQVAAHPFFAQ